MSVLKLNADTRILWQMEMSVAKDTIVAKAFSTLTLDALPRETEGTLGPLGLVLCLQLQMLDPEKAMK